MADNIRLAAVVLGADGMPTVEDLGLCERGQGGAFAVAAPANTLFLVEQSSAGLLAQDLLAWAVQDPKVVVNLAPEED